MDLRALLSIPLSLTALITHRFPYLSAHLPQLTSSSRGASTMAMEPGKMNVLHGPLQAHTSPSDSTHPTGYFRDGYCWGSDMDAGKHFLGGIVTNEFLEFSKDRGNDLMTKRGGFPGLKDGCRWCLCVDRWKEALMASEKMGDKVVPRVDLQSTAFDALKTVTMEDLQRFKWTNPRDDL